MSNEHGDHDEHGDKLQRVRECQHGQQCQQVEQKIMSRAAKNEFFTKFVQGGGTLYSPFGYIRKYTKEKEVTP